MEAPVVGEVIAGISAFKTMFDIAKSMKDLDDTVKRNAAVSDLWEQIFAAQSRYSEAVERVAELEKKLASFETWNAEKQRYELREVSTGVFAYTLKSGMEQGQPQHMLCANCYDHGERSTLQETQELIMRRRVHICPNCNSKFAMGAQIPRSAPGQAITDYDPFTGR